jgi:hypothetical protein
MLLQLLEHHSGLITRICGLEGANWPQIWRTLATLTATCRQLREFVNTIDMWKHQKKWRSVLHSGKMIRLTYFNNELDFDSSVIFFNNRIMEYRMNWICPPGYHMNARYPAKLYVTCKSRPGWKIADIDVCCISYRHVIINSIKDISKCAEGDVIINNNEDGYNSYITDFSKIE